MRGTIGVPIVIRDLEPDVLGDTCVKVTLKPADDLGIGLEDGFHLDGLSKQAQKVVRVQEISSKDYDLSA
jgi:hypothetical protein